MTHLVRAARELFRRRPDECFPSLAALAEHCQWQKSQSVEMWQPPCALQIETTGESLSLAAGNESRLTLNDWSFGQLCRLAGVAKETVNRLSPATAERVLRETLPQGGRPLQLFAQADQLRSLHGASYTRLYNADLLNIVRARADGFQPPPVGMQGATGLYGGEQDLFCFLIDPDGWTEIGGEMFAPGFFVWNSEVGSRSVGIETFWYQAICANHIVWDAVQVVQLTRKHTAQVHEVVEAIGQAITALVRQRDTRRDGFVRRIESAMQTTLGRDVEDVVEVVVQAGIPRRLAQQAVTGAQQRGPRTVFALVDALTRLAGQVPNAAQRVALDQKAAQLLALAP